MALCYKGRSIEVVLGNTIVYFANDRKHVSTLCMCVGNVFVAYQKAVYITWCLRDKIICPCLIKFSYGEREK